MVTLGVDSHKRTHTLVVVDANGAEIASRTVRTTTDGHLDALRWARTWEQRRWALENCRPLCRRLEADLLRGGETVLLVPGKLMARVRMSGRERGKSDPIDALAVARAALREANLPVARLEGPSRDVKLLLDHREDLVGERTRFLNRLRWHLHELEPGLEIGERSLIRYCVMDRVALLLGRHTGLVAEIASEELVRIRELTLKVNSLERRLEMLVRRLAPSLVQLYGCGVLCAAKVLAETADVSRFGSRGAFAMNNGTAPIPVWSGNTVRHRLNRGGNRQLNSALHIIAVIQSRDRGLGRDYFEKRRAAGNTKREAFRALRRRISDEVYRRLWRDLHAATCVESGAAA
jgi:transposase